MSVRILITDCDHGQIDFEQAVARERGIELSLAACRTEDDVITAAGSADGIIVQYAPVTGRVLDRLPRLRAIGRYGVGVDTIDVAAATVRGVLVTNVPDYGTEDVSDHALALMLSAVRGVTRMDRRVRAGEHSLEPVMPLHRVRSRVLGVVGLGHIGAAVARKAHGVGFTVIGSDPMLEPGSTTADGVEVVQFEDVLARADVISLHLPLLPSTHHLIDDRALAVMKPDSILVNTSRGAIVHTEALIDALRSGRIGGAGLDVFEVEPLPADSPLMALDNVILTPHAGWYSEESYGELKRRVTENVADACAGIRPRNVVNPSVLDREAMGSC